MRETSNATKRLICRIRVAATMLVCLLKVAGCTAQPSNPSFPTNVANARTDLSRMEDHPHALRRPLVIVGGIMDPGIACSWERSEFSKLTGDNRIVAVALGDCFTFEACRKKIVQAVNDTFPDHPPDRTVQVDVVGYSLGGVAARHAGRPDQPGPRLDIARLFTISSPNRGAVAANFPLVIDPVQGDLRPGSQFISRLNHEPADYPVYSYVCLGDPIIGDANAALPGQTPWWVPDAPLTTPHTGAFFDPRILADIARRLRDEPALTHSPPTTLPVPNPQ